MSTLVPSGTTHNCLIYLRKCWFLGFSSLVSLVSDQIEFGLLFFFEMYNISLSHALRSEDIFSGCPKMHRFFISEVGALWVWWQEMWTQSLLLSLKWKTPICPCFCRFHSENSPPPFSYALTLTWETSLKHSALVILLTQNKACIWSYLYSVHRHSLLSRYGRCLCCLVLLQFQFTK